MIMEDKIVIERNGIRHTLVYDGDGDYCDYGCTLTDICEKCDICLCRVMGCVGAHFELEVTK